jgi:hypothetical protein
MIVAVIAVGKMQPAVYEIIEMVTVRDRFVSTVRAMLVEQRVSGVPRTGFVALTWITCSSTWSSCTW